LGILSRVAARIESSRLWLVSMGTPVLEALLADDRITAERLLGCRIPADYPLERMPVALRLKQLRADPSEEPWLLRAMVDRDSETMIGHIGFHAPPHGEYLAEIAPDGVEIGYTVHLPFRRQGYAKEAVLALMHWAFSRHEQRCFVLFVSPQNFPSTAMAESLGFAKCGSNVDDIDGVETIFVRRFEKWPVEWGVNSAC
jgi:ribosomal-protein-alanine N-acetyltransferase